MDVRSRCGRRLDISGELGCCNGGVGDTGGSHGSEGELVRSHRTIGKFARVHRVIGDMSGPYCPQRDIAGVHTPRTLDVRGLSRRSGSTDADRQAQADGPAEYRNASHGSVLRLSGCGGRYS